MNFNVQDMWPQLMTLLGGIVWAVRLEGKVKMLEAVHEQQNEDIKARLVRIENKIDKATGSGIVTA